MRQHKIEYCQGPIRATITYDDADIPQLRQILRGYADGTHSGMKAFPAAAGGEFRVMDMTPPIATHFLGEMDKLSGQETDDGQAAAAPRA